MQLTQIPFSELPFSKLFNDYISGESTVNRYYHFPCREKDIFKKKYEETGLSVRRDTIADILTSLNEQYTDREAVFVNIDKLRDPDTRVVVTGQQLTMHGGPVFTVLKIISAISLAQKLTRQLNTDVVPVFWLADEDHDFEEINHVNLPSDNGFENVVYETDSENKRVSDLLLDQQVIEFNEEVFELLDGTDFSSKLQAEIDQCYKKGASLKDAFAAWILKLFGDYGLVLCGSNIKEVKDLTADLMKKSVELSDEIKQQVEYVSSKLEEDGYHAQVQVYESNLFHIAENGARDKISTDGKTWKTDERSWSADELMAEIDRNPERFSPNVFLRPILQDSVLPTIAYVGGPGEIAYYAQMQPIYEAFNKKMPVVWPRFSATIAETAISRIIGKLPFSFPEYNQRIEDLEKAYVKQTESIDPEPLFGRWKGEIKELEKEKTNFIREIDASLGPAVGKATAVYFSELDKLKGKLYRSMKEQESVQLNRIAKIKHSLFPGNALQERQIAFIYFMNKYGPDIWDKLFEQLDESEPFTHKLVEL